MANKDIRILVVDGFATMRRILRNILTQIGFTNIVEADDGDIALEKLEEGEFDFVITDWNMPNMTGLELLKSIRASEKLKDIPVLLVTSEADKENVIQAVQAGVNDYIVKPFTADVIQEKIDKIFP